MEKMKQESKVKKPLKIWQGVLTLLVSAIILFVAAPILLSPFGMYGSLLGELLLLGVAVGAVLLFRGDLREVFPLKKPHFSGIAGTILIWVGTFLCEMVLLLILSLFFPEQILEVNDGLSSSIAAGPFLLSFVTVAISPAICEEALFRGTFVSSLRGRLGKWAVLLISGCIFGMFHYQLSTAVVDENHAVFHFRDIFFIDYAFCLREERTVKEDHIRPGKQGV